ELAAQGVIFCPLDEALRNHSDIVREYFQKHPVDLGSDKFVSLNVALTGSGALLYVPRGVECPLPFVVQHTLSGAGASAFPHTIMVVEQQAQATLVEFFMSGDGTRQLLSGVNDLYGAPGSRLTYVGAQDLSREALAFQSNSIVAQRDARVVSLN